MSDAATKSDLEVYDALIATIQDRLDAVEKNGRIRFTNEEYARRMDNLDLALARLAIVEDKAATVGAALADILGRLDAIEGAVEGVTTTTTTTTVGSALADIIGRLDSVEEFVTNRLDAVSKDDGVVLSVEDRLAKVESLLARGTPLDTAVLARMDALDNNLTTLATDSLNRISAIEARFSSLDVLSSTLANHDKHSERLLALEDRTVALENTVTQNITDITAIKNSYENRLIKLESDVLSVKERLLESGTLSEDDKRFFVDTYESRLAKLEETAPVSSEQDRLLIIAEAAERVLHDLKPDLASIKEAYDSIFSKLEEAQSNGPVHNTDLLPDYESRLVDLEAAIRAVGEAIETLAPPAPRAAAALRLARAAAQFAHDGKRGMEWTTALREWRDAQSG